MASPARSNGDRNLSGNRLVVTPCEYHGAMEATMMKGGLLWLIGIPIPIILILFFLGYLH